LVKRHQKAQQPFNGKLLEIAPQHFGNVRLFYAKEICGFGLLEASVFPWPVVGFEAIRIYYALEADAMHIIRILHGKRGVRRILENA